MLHLPGEAGNRKVNIKGLAWRRSDVKKISGLRIPEAFGFLGRIAGMRRCPGMKFTCVYCGYADKVTEFSYISAAG